MKSIDKPYLSLSILYILYKIYIRFIYLISNHLLISYSKYILLITLTYLSYKLLSNNILIPYTIIKTSLFQ